MKAEDNLKSIRDQLAKGFFPANLYDLVPLCRRLDKNPESAVAGFVLSKVFETAAGALDDRPLTVAEANRWEGKLTPPIQETLDILAREHSAEDLYRGLAQIILALGQALEEK